jgi:hypothetical protein
MRNARPPARPRRNDGTRGKEIVTTPPKELLTGNAALSAATARRVVADLDLEEAVRRVVDGAPPLPATAVAILQASRLDIPTKAGSVPRAAA